MIARELPDSAPHKPSTGITDENPAPAGLFTWLLGIQTEVPMLIKQEFF